MSFGRPAGTILCTFTLKGGQVAVTAGWMSKILFCVFYGSEI